MSWNHARAWLHDALELLELRSGSRVLQLTAHDLAQTRALLDLCGDDGSVVVVEPSQPLAQRIREVPHGGLHVVAIEPAGHEDFGRFDAILACPSWNPGWSTEQWSAILQGGLRPGGRFVLDLPAERSCKPIDEALRQVGDADSIQRWRGPSPQAIRESMEAAGLRSVQVDAATHVENFESPFALAELAVAELDASSGLAESLGLALVQQLETNREIEIVFRRTRAHGMR